MYKDLAQDQVSIFFKFQSVTQYIENWVNFKYYICISYYSTKMVLNVKCILQCIADIQDFSSLPWPKQYSNISILFINIIGDGSEVSTDLNFQGVNRTSSNIVNNICASFFARIITVS